MDETRDTELGHGLEVLREPDHGPDYWRQVRLRVAEAGAAHRRGPLRRLRAVVGPRPLRLALAGLLATAVAAAVLLVGLPQTESPQRVSAAAVLRRALSRCSSGHTFRSDAIVRFYASGMWDPEVRYDTFLVRVLQVEDGSYRLTFHAGPSPRSRVTKVESYDAGTGVLARRGAGRPWRITSHFPPGPPDGPAAATATGADFGAILRAVSTSTRLSLDEAVIGGRHAWTVTCTKGDLAGLPRTNVDWPVYTIAVDKQTWLPVRYKVIVAGILMLDVRYGNVRIDTPVSRNSFTAPPSRTDEVRRSDRGFTRVTLDAAANMHGVRAVVPLFRPQGYQLCGCWVATESESVNRLVRARDVFVLQFRSGFDALTVSTRRVYDPSFTPQTDPFESRAYPDWSRMASTTSTLRSGAFAGATARIVVATDVSAPHLWAVKDGVLLTIAGGATARGLLGVAESLQAFAPAPASAAD